MAFFRRSKNTNSPILKQILDRIPKRFLQQETRRYQADKGYGRYKTNDQLVVLIFGQLNKCYTLADISCGSSISRILLSDIGVKQSTAKSMMSDGKKS